MKIKVDLSTSGIQDAIRQIEAYKNSLPYKCHRFAEELANLGIQVANYNTVSSLVQFSKEFSDRKDGCKAIMYGFDIMPIINTWVGEGGEIKQAEVSPLLMSEFGSGFKAQNPLNVPNYGQGTFPNQEHAFDTNGWWWMDLDGQWHHSYGFEPSQPMYKALIAMQMQIETVAKQVFRS